MSAKPDRGRPFAVTMSAHELAQAMQEGLEARRAHRPREEERPVSLPQPPPVRPLLLPLSSSLGHPATALPGRFSRLVRLLRRGLKAFMRPWLDVQTRFNHATIEVLEDNNRALMQGLQQLADRVHAHDEFLTAVDSHIYECFRGLQAERGALERLDLSLRQLIAAQSAATTERLSRLLDERLAEERAARVRAVALVVGKKA